MAPLITLTSDYGLRDPYVGALKGSILRQCPNAKLVDISHTVSPYDLLEASFVVANSTPYFPAGTIHVIAVDPHGDERDMMVAQFGGQVYIFPDNGVITFIKQALPLEAIIAADKNKILPRDLAKKLHGRDLLVPLIGVILRGMNINRLGKKPETYKLLELPHPITGTNEIGGQVIYIDSFGNLITNINVNIIKDNWPDVGNISVECNGKVIDVITDTYANKDVGQSFAIVNPMGMIEIAINQGRACEIFNAAIGSEVKLSVGKFINHTS